MSKKTVKIVAIVIAVIFILGILGPLAYMFVFSEPMDNAAEIEEAERRLEAAQQLESSITEECGTRFRIMCERGMMSYLDIIFSSDTVSDFADRIVIAEELAEYDKNIMDTIQSIKNEIYESKTALEALQNTETEQ